MDKKKHYGIKYGGKGRNKNLVLILCKGNSISMIDVYDYTFVKDFVNCKRCLKKLTQNDNTKKVEGVNDN